MLLAGLVSTAASMVSPPGLFRVTCSTHPRYNLLLLCVLYDMQVWSQQLRVWSVHRPSMGSPEPAQHNHGLVPQVSNMAKLLHDCYLSVILV
jgi:hypothetical protein